MHQRSAARHGQSVIETAVVLPLLLLLLAGIIDLGRSFNSYIVVTNAAREGVRYASRFPHDRDGIQEAAIQEADASGVALDAGRITVECWNRQQAAIACQHAKSGDRARVTVEYSVSVILGSFIGQDTLLLSHATTMVVFGLDGE